MEIHAAELQVLIDGRRVGFTVREFQIFSVLAARPDRVVRRFEIHEQIWGAPWVHRDRSVDVLVRKVRGKLAAVSPDRTYVHTHLGIGYRYTPEPMSSPAETQGRRRRSDRASPLAHRGDAAAAHQATRRRARVAKS